MKCCAECFGDRGLRENIIPSKSQAAIEVGRCSYCESENVAVLAPAELAVNFKFLISAYRTDSKGKLLVEWFREDWDMFRHPRMDLSRAKDLLAEILDDGDIVRQTFSPANDYAADRLGEWEKLRDELMYHNRFWPETNIDLDRLDSLFELLEAKEPLPLWYRARIQAGEAPFLVAEMGAPPNRLASHGRANPAGIPYLYLGSTTETAISETRPHRGEMVCVADFKTPGNLQLIDLRRPRKMVSPFLLEDTASICKMRADLPFLERLGDELTRPVLPRVAAIDYTPTQYLCERIKKCGYDGVIYRSSVSDGMNLALFTPALAQSGTVIQYSVTDVSVHVEVAGQ